MMQHKSLEVRLAETPAEIEAAQELRYQVFYEELNASPSPQMRAVRRDFDELDSRCDHLLVIDHEGRRPAVVGTYRLNLQTSEKSGSEFYSAGEYDLTRLLQYPGRLLEVGRSCVAPDYRRGSVMQMLWIGIAEYMARNDVGAMFGCASFQGCDPEAQAQALSYLHHNHLAPPELRARALGSRYVTMDRIPAAEIDVDRAKASLPPLIKGYLRLGGYVGDGAVIDPQFGTVDVCIVVEANRIAQKYYRFYLHKPGARKAA